ncbi:MAG: CheR family methyltransferase [Chthoniobacteraceae bacterium]
MSEEIARILHATIGLDAASIGLSAIERAVLQRVAACRISGPHTYAQHLRSTPGEMQALVEAVVVPETWFFRDAKAFEAVAAHARSSTKPDRLNFVTIPCSTGEEPYSLAMAMLDAGIPASRFHIDAYDVSERALAHARAGVYGRNSFRGRDVEFRDRYFEATPEGHRIAPAVRECVQFHHGNLLEESSVTRGRTYDAVFCRNLLIYFDPDTQHRAITTLERLLAQDGLFCVGPAETGLLAARDFTHTRISLAFAFRKGRPQPAPVAQPTSKRAIPAPVSKPKPLAKPSPNPAPKPVAAPVADLAHATRLADEGRLAEVEAICEASIQQSGPSAQAHFLLGLVNDAADRAVAATAHYRKAIYLNPQHHDALLHYSLLTARHGDANAALALRKRAQRCTEQAA